MRLLRRRADEDGARAPASHSQWRKGKSSTAEAFFRTDTDRHDGPILVYHHVPKTAGTALRQLIRINLPPSERVGVRSPRGASPRATLLDWYREWYESFAASERDRLCCVMSHSAGYVLPALDRPAAELLLAREPVDRVLSHFHYTKARRRRTNRVFKDEPIDAIYTRFSGRLPPDRADALHPSNQYFNGQSRTILRVWYDVSVLPYSEGPCPDADLWRERLFAIVDAAFCAGVQDRFADFADVLARRLGWRAEVPRAKVNKRRPSTSSLDPELRATILAHNWLDAELHRRCAERLDASLADAVSAPT
jgi:hypothetical protein